MSLENYTEEQRATLAKSMDALLRNPEVSKDAKKLLKKVDPKLSFPELELDERIEKATEQGNERIKKLEDELNVERRNREYRDQLQAVREKGFEPTEVEKIMTEHKIADYSTAMKFMEMERSLAPPTPESLTPFTMPDETKDIMKNPKQWANRKGMEALNEILKQRRAQGR